MSRQELIILSAESSKNTHEGNRARTETLKGVLTDCQISFDTALGVYNNEATEDSIVAIINNADEYQAVIDFAFLNFDQESILYQDANQEAHLVFANGTSERLGRLEAVEKEVALKTGSYTLLNDIYYTTIKK